MQSSGYPQAVQVPPGQDAEAASRGCWGDRTAHGVRTPRVGSGVEHFPGLFRVILQFPQGQVPVHREKQEAVGPVSGTEDKGTLHLSRPPPQGGQHLPPSVWGQGSPFPAVGRNNHLWVCPGTATVADESGPQGRGHSTDRTFFGLRTQVAQAALLLASLTWVGFGAAELRGRGPGTPWFLPVPASPTGPSVYIPHSGTRNKMGIVC